MLFKRGKKAIQARGYKLNGGKLEIRKTPVQREGIYFLTIITLRCLATKTLSRNPPLLVYKKKRFLF
jgi:hypothetical protein